MNQPIAIRLGQSPDFEALAEVMYDAIWHGPSLYSEAQRHAWCPSVPNGHNWNQRLSEQIVYLAVQGSNIVGFMSLASDGYIDFAYIRAAFQKQGIFRQLYAEIEKRARNAGETRVWTHASLMAQPAFSAMGLSIIESETVERMGQKLPRFKMEKLLW